MPSSAPNRRRGQAIGCAVLADSLARIVEATKLLAARFVVDALHEHAAAFTNTTASPASPTPCAQKISYVAPALTT